MLSKASLPRRQNRVKLSLIMSTYEQPLVLAKALDGMSRQDRWPDEMFIIDDGSGPETRQVIDQWKSKASGPVQHLWHPHDGFRKIPLLNKATAAATGDYLVFTDGDCVPHRRFISDHEGLAQQGFWVQGRRCFVREPFVQEFSASATPVWRWMLTGRITGAAKGIRLPFPVVRRDQAQRGIIGCNMAFWREDLVAVNGFDESFVGWGVGEDSDVGTRLYHLGRSRKFVYGHAIIYHLNHPVLPRDHVPASHAKLAETIRSRRVRCEKGLDQYL